MHGTKIPVTINDQTYEAATTTEIQCKTKVEPKKKKKCT